MVADCSKFTLDKIAIAKFIGSLAGPPIVVFLWFRLLVGDSVLPDRLMFACGLMVQVDSFLIAGFLVGVMWYWKVLFAALGPQLPYGIIATIATPLLSFTVSSFAAITSVLTGSIVELEVAFVFTIYGIVVVIDAWNVLHKGVNSLAPSRKFPDSSS